MAKHLIGPPGVFFDTGPAVIGDPKLSYVQTIDFQIGQVAFAALFDEVISPESSNRNAFWKAR